MNYLEWVDQQIEFHEKEIARLMIARGVIEQAASTLSNIALATKRKQLAKPGMKRGDTRKHITDALLAIGRPATSREIIGAVRAKHANVSDKMVWNTLYHMRSLGVIEKDSAGLHYLGDVATPDNHKAA